MTFDFSKHNKTYGHAIPIMMAIRTLNSRVDKYLEPPHAGLGTLLPRYAQINLRDEPEVRNAVLHLYHHFGVCGCWGRNRAGRVDPLQGSPGRGVRFTMIVDREAGDGFAAYLLADTAGAFDKDAEGQWQRPAVEREEVRGFVKFRRGARP